MIISNKVLLNITSKDDKGEELSSNYCETSIMEIKRIGDTTWSITGLSEGTEVIEFYESCPGGESITYIINVDSDLNVTLEQRQPTYTEKKNPAISFEGNKISILIITDITDATNK